eukprot:TRINITY_DN11857_c0_g1_i4.p1 TRINITY_DN11857_c0_g1~~TRINITY_DN11857_c0_g1_i4.p1  ORF type:complete len:546 (+),score=45.52 TRINITY_DN11857_c0_g1_i4:52-1689(+)
MEVIAKNDASFLSAHHLQAHFEVVVDSSPLSFSNSRSRDEGFSQSKKLEEAGPSFIDKAGRRHTKIIDLGEVYVNHLYRNRSFVISNTSNIPLEFVLTCEHDPNIESELYFSLSNTSLKLFNSLTIEPQHQVRIYLHFQPHKIFQSMAEDTNYLKEAYININCRTIKDYQETILFRANCRPPQVRVSLLEVVFVGQKVQTSESNEHDNEEKEPINLSLDVSPAQQELVIRNLYNRPLTYTVRNSSLYFIVENLTLGEPPVKNMATWTIQEPNAEHILIVRPNMQVVIEHHHLFIKNKYVEEHLTIYNRSQLSEKYLVSLRFTTGILRHFFLAPGPKNAFPFSKLEDTVAKFLQDFSKWTHPLFHLHRSQSSFSAPSSLLHSSFSTSSIESLDSEADASNSTNSRAMFTLDWVELFLDACSTEAYAQLFFDYRYITDEFVFYGLKGYVGHFAFQLADLLYSFVFKDRLFNHLRRLWLSETTISSSHSYRRRIEGFVESWVIQLKYFLDHFPRFNKDTAPLRQLYQQILLSIAQASGQQGLSTSPSD